MCYENVNKNTVKIQNLAMGRFVVRIDDIAVGSINAQEGEWKYYPRGLSGIGLGIAAVRKLSQDNMFYSEVLNVMDAQSMMGSQPNLI